MRENERGIMGLSSERTFKDKNNDTCTCVYIVATEALV